METLKQSGLWNSLSTYASLVVIWWLYISNSGEARKFDISSQIWHWILRSTSPPPPKKQKKTVGNLTKVFCISGPTLVILAWNGDELWSGQVQNGVNFDF